MQFGKYQVLEQVGEGGFGRVYRGYDPTLKREVAIKVCTLRAAELRARFVREAEIAANLRHPNVVTVYDFGEESGEPYLVQEFLAGEDLDAVIARREPLPLSRKIDLLIQIARGLGFAHAKGVVHRDVKPSNMRVLPDGVVRIMDFGIAKLLEAELQFTQVGMSVGTVGYLSPEQLRGEEIDHRADIFSFGVLAYELLSYEKPFAGDNVTTIFYRIAQEEPPPIGTRVPDCPPRLAACVERCLRKQRGERFSSFAAVIEELESVRAGEATPARQPALAHTAGTSASTAEHASTRRRPAVWGLITAALAVALFGIFNVARWGETTPGREAPTGASVPAEDGSQDDAAGSSELAGSTAIPPSDTLSSVANPAIDPRAPGGAAAGGGAAEGGRDVAAISGGRGTPSAGGSGGGRTAGEVGGGAAAGGGPPAVEAGRAAAAGGGAAAEGGGAAAAAGGHARPGGGGTGDGGGGKAVTAATTPPVRRVLVLLVGPPGPLESAEAALVRELLEGGAEVVDGAMASDAATAQSGAGLGGVARRFGAGTVLVGDLTAQAQPSVGRFFTGSATLALKSYDGATGKLLDVENHQVGAGQTPGKLGNTELAAATEAATEVGRRAGRAALRRINAR